MTTTRCAADVVVGKYGETLNAYVYIYIYKYMPTEAFAGIVYSSCNYGDVYHDALSTVTAPRALYQRHKSAVFEAAHDMQLVAIICQYARCVKMVDSLYY